MSKKNQIIIKRMCAKKTHNAIAAGILGGALLFVPLSASANIEITEIMYNPDRSDSNREWIEVYNSGTDSAALAEWTFFENDTDHGISATMDGTSVPADGFAVIADDPDAFQSDYPGYGGVLFDSSFELNNTGEPVAMKDPDGIVLDSVTYEPLEAANDTGASLQKQSDGSWIASFATPGWDNSNEPFEVSEEDEENPNSGSFEDFSPFSDDWPFRGENMYLDAGEPLRAFVGERIHFLGRVRDYSGDDVNDVDVSWAFGNGDGEDKEEAYYTYDTPGQYIAVLRVERDGTIMRAKRKVHVVVPAVEISEAGDGFVKITNNGDFAANLSEWEIRNTTEGLAKPIVPGTFIAPHTTVSIPFSTVTSSSSLELVMENETPVDTESAVRDARIEEESAKLLKLLKQLSLY